ncbi:MAG: amidohydrolase [Thermomonas sp.]
MRLLPLSLALAALLPQCALAAERPEVAAAAQSERNELIAWRRDIHQHPELGNHETRTAQLIADKLRSFGLEPKTGVGHTGVVAILKGGKPGPRIALRADMDALPVTEQTGLPFASTVKSEYRGQPVGVMHACGHDMHVAIMLGVAEALSKMKADLPGEVMFVFQPAEEGPPTPGETAGAKLMMDEGLFRDFKPDAVLGLHVWASLRVGDIGVRAGPTMAAVDEWTLKITGKQTHGARPWDGVDPITVGAQILLGTQSIIARQVNIANSPVVLTTGLFQSGVRFNIIPDDALLVGTLRTFDHKVRADVVDRFRRTATDFAEASGAKAELEVDSNAPALVNDPALVAKLRPSLEAAVGKDHVIDQPPLTVSEDFAYYAGAAPVMFFFVGSTPADKDPAAMPMNHSPLYSPDEGALDVGLRAMLQATLDFLGGGAPAAVR